VLRTAILSLAVAWAVPSLALAHPLVDEGVRRLHDADFAGALQLFGDAERSDDLTRADLVTLLEARATVHLALDDRLSADSDLRMLAALDHDHPVSSAASPDFTEAFERAVAAVREGLSISATHTRSGDRVQIDTWIRADPAGLVRSIRVFARRGDSPWGDASPSQARVSASPDTRVSYYAEAIGPGGAVVATIGSRQHPRSVPVGDSGENGGVPWLWIGVGAGATALVATIAVVLVATSGGGDTVIDGPYPTD